MARTKNKVGDNNAEVLKTDIVQGAYVLPDSWKWVRLRDICDFERGITFPASAKENEPTNDNIACVRTANVQEELDLSDLIYVRKDYLKANDKKILRKDDIIMSTANSRELVGKTCYVHEVATDMAFGGFVLVIRSSKVNNRYLYYYLRYQFLMGNFRGESNQTTNIANISTKVLGEYAFPLPPNEVQEGIVNAIESMMEKLHKASDNLGIVTDTYEDYQSSVYKAAFSGELSKQWRKDNGLEGSWSNIAIKDVCDINPRKIDTKELEDDLQVSFFPMPALDEKIGAITDPQVRELREVKKGFTNFKEGDVVFAKITPCMENGKSAVIGELENNIGFGTTEFYVFRCGNKILNRYLHFVFRDKRFRDKAKGAMTGAVGQQRVPKAYLEEYILHLPTVEEQKYIVNKIDEIFSKTNQMIVSAETTQDYIETIQKAILAEAFHGKIH